MKKILLILVSLFCLNSLFALTLPGIGKGTPVQERVIKGGKIGYVITNKEIMTENQLIQFYNEVSKSEYKYVIIHFIEDNTALHIIPKIGSVTYGTYDRTNLCLKTELGWMSIFGTTAAKEEWPEDIFREE